MIIGHDHPDLLPLPSNFENRTLVLSPNALNKRYRISRYQLVRCTGGFGARPDTLGSKVFGYFLTDNEDGSWRRGDFIGEASPALIKFVMHDKTEPAPIDINERCYLVIGNGYYASGETLEEAKVKLRKLSGSRKKPKMAFYTHPEAYVSEMGYIVHPRDTELTPVKL